MKKKKDEALKNLTKRLGREPNRFELEEEEEAIRERRRRQRLNRGEKQFLTSWHGEEWAKPHSAPAWLKPSREEA